MYIIAGTVVTIILALPFNEVANHLVFHPALVGGLLIVTGGVLFLSEYLSKKEINNKRSGVKTGIVNWFSSGGLQYYRDFPDQDGRLQLVCLLDLIDKLLLVIRFY